MRYLKPSALILLLLVHTILLAAENGRADRKWVASWTTAISGTYTGKELQFLGDSIFYNMYMHPESNLGLPDARANNQTFRMIVKPDLWGDTVRIRFSNVFGDSDLRLAAASVGLQEVSAQLVPDTNVAITFGGKPGLTLSKGSQVFSDPIRLPYVTEATKRWLRGRNLAVSFAIEGKSGSLSSHQAPVYSYFSRPDSGDLVQEYDDDKFPFVTKTHFLVSELDVIADSDTTVICAFGDSITDGGMTVNGYDGWSDVLSRRLHKVYGDKVSVVNMAIGGNTIVADLGGSEPAVKRLDRDVLEISGLTSVIWLEGINDLGASHVTLDEIMEGIKQVTGRLRTRGIRVIGATLTSSLGPRATYEASPSWRRFFSMFHGSTVNDNRKTLNSFILNSSTFDGVVDMSSVTEDPRTGTLYEEMHIGDYLHPNRIGHQEMAGAIGIDSLVPASKRPTAPVTR